MARELTQQERASLDRIREQMAESARELSQLTRDRQRLQAQLSEIQRQMASPDGITSAQQFVDEVTRIRRELQILTAREQDADAARSRLSTEELRIYADAAERPQQQAGLNRTQRTVPSSQTGIAPATAALLQSESESLQFAQSQHERNSAARTSLEKKLTRDIKKSLLVVFLLALFVAVIADILSIVDLGWIVSWSIPMISWFIVRRVVAINKGGDAIVAAHNAAKRQLTLLTQRLRPALISSGNTKLLQASNVSSISFRARSYVTTFVRNTVITQLLELIPIVDILPFYIGQVVKLFIDQNIAYQKVKKLMPGLKNVHQQIALLEQFEIQYTAGTIAAIINAQQLSNRRQRQKAQALEPQQAVLRPDLSLEYAT